MKCEALITVKFDIPDDPFSLEEAYGDPNIAPYDAASHEVGMLSVIHEQGLDVLVSGIEIVDPRPTQS